MQDTVREHIINLLREFMKDTLKDQNDWVEERKLAFTLLQIFDSSM